MANLPAHSPLGASGASRWMKCPASPAFSQGWGNPESEFARQGTIAHALAARCLETGEDAWMYIGSDASLFEGYDVDADMAEAVQTYLQAIRDQHEDRNQGNFWIERRFHCPSIHEHFFGTADAVYLDEDEKRLHVWDYKHGAGIVVDAPHNVQLMYYAVGALEDLGAWQSVDDVTIHIAQPRGFHYAGPIREWTISVTDLEDWLTDELLPAMDNAMVSRDPVAGEHCWSCPAAYGNCPAIADSFDELENMMAIIEEKGVEALTNEQVGRYMELFAVAKIAAANAGKTAYTRLQAGHEVPGQKLVKGRANRVFKEGAEEAMKEEFGDRAYEKKLLSPAKLEKVLGGKKFVAEWSRKPPADPTMVPVSDKRPAIQVDAASVFTKK